MGLIVTTKADVTDLIELATIKTRLGISGSSEDSLLGELIDEASSAIVDYVGRDLARQTYAETMKGLGRTRALLSRFPVDSDSVTATIEGVAETGFAVQNAETGILWLEDAWDDRWEDEETVSVSYKAGFLIPQTATAKGNVTTWTASAAYVAGAWVRPSTPSLSPFFMECSTAGTAGGSEPTWPAAGSTVTDGTVGWTARRAWELPNVIRSCAWLTVQDLYSRQGAERPGLVAWSAAGHSETYASDSTSADLPPNVKRTLDRWRLQ
jgi:hypothetical protein